MTIPDALHVEMYVEAAILDEVSADILDAAGNVISDVTAWVSIVDDVLTDSPLVVFQGQRGSEPDDRVADAGSIRFMLDNSANNSAATVGYYSPDHASVRAGFGVGTVVRVGLEKDGAIQYLSQGRIMTIDPTTGNLSKKTVDVVAADWMDIAARTQMPWVRLVDYYNFTDDEVIAEILTNLDDLPEKTDFDTGSYVYPYPLNDLNDGKETVMTVLQRLAVNGLGRIYIVGNTESGEVLKYVSKDTLLAGSSVVATFDNDFEEMDLTRQAYRRVKRVVVEANNYTGRYGAVYANTAEVEIAAGATVELICKYADTVPVVDLNKEIPAGVFGAITGDMRLSSVAGTGSDDLHSSLGIVSKTIGTNSFQISLDNTSGVTGYLLMVVYGTGLYQAAKNIYTVEDTSIPEGQGVTLRWDAAYQNTRAAAVEIGDLLMSWHGVDLTAVKSLKFTPTLDAENYAKMVDCKPGTRVHVTDDVSGIDVDVLVNGFELQIWNSGALMRETLFVSRTV